MTAPDWDSALILGVQMKMTLLILQRKKITHLLRDMKWVNGVLAVLFWWLIEILLSPPPFTLEHGQKLCEILKFSKISMFYGNKITLEQKTEWTWNCGCHYILSLCKAWSFNFLKKKSAYFVVTKENMLFCLIGF